MLDDQASKLPSSSSYFFSRPLPLRAGAATAAAADAASSSDSDLGPYLGLCVIFEGGKRLKRPGGGKEERGRGKGSFFQETPLLNL